MFFPSYKYSTQCMCMLGVMLREYWKINMWLSSGFIPKTYMFQYIMLCWRIKPIEREREKDGENKIERVG